MVALLAGRAAVDPFFAQEIVRELPNAARSRAARAIRLRTGVVEIQVPATLQATITATSTACNPPPNDSRCRGGDRVAVGPDLCATALQVAGARRSARVRAHRPCGLHRASPVHVPASPDPCGGLRSQLKFDRAQVHRHLAETIAARDAVSVDSYAALIAEHLEAAADWHAAYDWHMRAGAWSSVRGSAAARLAGNAPAKSPMNCPPTTSTDS